MINLEGFATGGIVGFAVGIVAAAVMVMLGEKRDIKRLEESLGARWKMRLETIKTLFKSGGEILSAEGEFLLKVVDALRKD